jgi:hypothetical protein
MQRITFIMPDIWACQPVPRKKENCFAVKEVSVCATIYWFAGRGSPLLGLWQ